MKYLLFNAVVLASLGYLFASEGRIDLPFGDDTAINDAETVQPVAETLPEAPPQTRTAEVEIPQDLAEEPVVQNVVAPTPVAEPTQIVEPTPVVDAAPVVESAPEVPAAVAPPVAETPVETAPVAPVQVVPEPVAPLIQTPVIQTPVIQTTPVQPTQTAEDNVFVPPPELAPEPTVVADLPAPTPPPIQDPLPELGDVEAIASLPEVSVPQHTVAEAPAPVAPVLTDPNALVAPPPVQIAEGQVLMTNQERTRELDILIEDMEMFYIERIAR